jgi:hypothetical protein
VFITEGLAVKIFFRLAVLPFLFKIASEQTTPALASG